METQTDFDDEVTIEGGNYAEIPDGTYGVTCTRLEKTEHEDWKGGPDFLKFYLALDMYNDNGDPIELTAEATFAKVTPKTKLGKWYAVLTGDKVEVGKTIHLGDMLGKQALAVIENKLRDDGGEWANIANLIPLPTAPASANGDIGKTRAEIKKLLASTFKGDERAAFEYIERKAPHAVKGTRVEAGNLTTEDCEAIKAELEASQQPALT